MEMIYRRCGRQDVPSHPWSGIIKLIKSLLAKAGSLRRVRLARLDSFDDMEMDERERVEEMKRLLPGPGAFDCSYRGLYRFVL